MTPNIKVREINREAPNGRIPAREILYSVCETKIGRCFIATANDDICALHIIQKKSLTPIVDKLKRLWLESEIKKSSKSSARFESLLNSIITNKCKLPLNILLRGSGFQLSVWKALLEIPYGETVSYSEIANLLKKPQSARAVGQAVGANPIALIIPCHRVLPANGAIGGYAWGQDVKKALLDIEKK